MNQHEKDEVTRLRKQGIGYKKISKLLGVNLNTIKSHCRYNNLTLSGLDTIPRCKNCQKAIEIVPHRKSKKFCCKECKIKWWNKNRRYSKSKIKVIVVCQNCNKTFKAYNWENRKYCGMKCYFEKRFRAFKGDVNMC